MRLALEFCGQFAKTTFSSLSLKKLEVGYRIEVRGLLLQLGEVAGLMLCSPSLNALVCSVTGFHVE